MILQTIFLSGSSFPAPGDDGLDKNAFFRELPVGIGFTVLQPFTPDSISRQTNTTVRSFSF